MSETNGNSFLYLGRPIGASQPTLHILKGAKMMARNEKKKTTIVSLKDTEKKNERIDWTDNRYEKRHTLLLTLY